MNESKYRVLEKYLVENRGGQLIFKTGCPLSDCSTFKIGGIADYAIYPFSPRVLCDLAGVLENLGIYYIVIGNASNVLFPDAGIRGAVIFTTMMREITFDGDTVSVQSGASLTVTALNAQRCGLSGLAFAYGIPGSCGGAIYMNAGAFEGKMSDVVLQSTYYDPKKREVFTIAGPDHHFEYRHSIYSENPGYIILSAVLQLSEGDPQQILDLMKAHQEYRLNSQPTDKPSAGSVFKRYPGYYTSRLIEEAGLKGYCVGGAQVSQKHAGFIINTGNATASDVIKLIEIIKKTIYEKNGIHIECEVKIIRQNDDCQK